MFRLQGNSFAFGTNIQTLQIHIHISLYIFTVYIIIYLLYTRRSRVNVLKLSNNLNK